MSGVACNRVDPTRPAFHSSDRIFPIGLQTAVQYLSAVKRGSGTKYTCVVADGAVAGASGPVFLVVAADAPGQQWLAQSPQTVWQQIHAQVGARGRGEWDYKTAIANVALLLIMVLGFQLVQLLMLH